jgi:transposase InsO family protein
MYDNRSEFKLHFEYLCESYGITRKPTTVKNPQTNGILERVHQVLGQMLRTAKLGMTNSVTPNDVNVFLDNMAWAICSTYHTVLKPPQVQPFSDASCSLTFCSWLTGAKLEDEGNH